MIQILKKNATKFDFISFDDVIKKGLNVMDSTAFTLSQENKLPIVIFDMNKQGNLLKSVKEKHRNCSKYIINKSPKGLKIISYD
jgi:uridylate kinase